MVGRGFLTPYFMKILFFSNKTKPLPQNTKNTDRNGANKETQMHTKHSLRKITLEMV